MKRGQLDFLNHIYPAFSEVKISIFNPYLKLLAIAFNLDSWMIPKVSRCTVDMLSQILYDQTQDVGKIVGLLIQHQQSQFI